MPEAHGGPQRRRRRWRTAESADATVDIGRVGPVRHWWRMHPRVGLALRTAVAAGLAWLLAQALPEAAAGRYGYFAPLGAVIVTSTTVVGTAREFGRSALALATGGVLGLAAVAVLPPTAISVAVVVGVGVLVAGWRRLGSASSWVPTVALFTMILGRDQPVSYVSAYAGLTGLGAAVAVGVVALAPQLVITPMEEAEHRLWLTITGRLRRLRDDLRTLETIGVLGEDELDSVRAILHQRLSEGSQGAQLNVRSRRYRVGDRRARAEAVDDLGARLAEFLGRLGEIESDPGLQRRAELNAALGDALDVILSALHNGDRQLLGDQFPAALAALDELVAELPMTDPGRYAVAATVDTARRLGIAADRAIDLTIRTGNVSAPGQPA